MLVPFSKIHVILATFLLIIASKSELDEESLSDPSLSDAFSMFLAVGSSQLEVVLMRNLATSTRFISCSSSEVRGSGNINSGLLSNVLESHFSPVLKSFEYSKAAHLRMLKK